jgi:hypothetical protein
MMNAYSPRRIVSLKNFGRNVMNKRKMLTNCPDLMKQWDYSKNTGISPFSLSAGSGHKVWWLCEKGHSWQATVNHRHRGTGCPVCANRIVVKGVNDLKTVNPDLAAQWNHEKNGTLRPEDVPAGDHRKVWWRCPKGHEWRAVIASRNQGYGCPCCAGQAVVKGVTDLATVRPDLAAQFDILKNSGISSSEICHSSNKKYWWLCELGHSWQASANARRKSGCPVCAGKVVLSGFNDLLSLNPVLAEQWDYEKNEIKPTEVALHSSKYAWWRCPKGHSWKAKVSNRQKGNGCPYCARKKTITGENDLATVMPELAAEWDNEKNNGHTPDQFLPQSAKVIWWKCKNGHSWRASIQRRYIGRGCPFCAGQIVVKGVNDLQSRFPLLAEQWDFTKNCYRPDKIHAYSNEYAWWLCDKGHSWRARINNRTSHRRGCPYCSGLLAIPGETDLFTRRPNLVKEWDYEMNTLNIHTTSEYSKKKAWWKCANGHSWSAVIHSRSRPNGNGCPYCAGKKAIPGETDLLTVAPHLAVEWDYERNTIDIHDITLKSNVKVWWVCKCGHRWKAPVCNRAIGSGCPRCAGKVIYSAKYVKG